MADFRISCRRHLPFCAVLVLSLAVGVYFCCMKEGYFLDEIYSYGLANSYFAPFLRDVFGGDLTGRVVSSQDLFDYVAVTGGQDAFSFASVYYNQTQDVHPPLFYWLMNVVSSFAPGTFSKWTGLGLNLVFFLVTLVLLYKLALDLLSDEISAAFTVGVYATSGMALSNLLMVRMYALLALFTVAFALLVLKAWRGGRWPVYAGLFAVAYLGLMTQYFFLFYAFFASVFFVVGSLVGRKELGRTLAYCGCVVGGGLAMLASFPACIEHLTSGFGGYGSVSEHASDSSGYLSSFIDAAHRASGSARALIVIAAVLVALAVVLAARRRLVPTREVAKVSEGTLLVVPALLSLVVVVVIAPLHSDRYEYHLISLLTLAVGWLFAWVKVSLGSRAEAGGRLAAFPCARRCVLGRGGCLFRGHRALRQGAFVSVSARRCQERLRPGTRLGPLPLLHRQRQSLSFRRPGAAFELREHPRRRRCVRQGSGRLLPAGIPRSGPAGGLFGDLQA